MKAWRNPIDPPSSRTIRAPTASRPSDLPWVMVSTAVGITTTQKTRPAIVTAAPLASSSNAEKNGVEMAKRMSSQRPMESRKSMIAPAALSTKLVGRRSSPTASPVISSASSYAAPTEGVTESETMSSI